MDAPPLSLMSAADGFVLSMLATMLLSMTVIGVLIFCMKRNVARRDSHVDALLEELAEDERQEHQTTTPTEPPKSEPWERDGDWWKH